VRVEATLIARRGLNRIRKQRGYDYRRLSSQPPTRNDRTRQIKVDRLGSRFQNTTYGEAGSVRCEIEYCLDRSCCWYHANRLCSDANFWIAHKVACVDDLTATPLRMNSSSPSPRNGLQNLDHQLGHRPALPTIRDIHYESRGATAQSSDKALRLPVPHPLATLLRRKRANTSFFILVLWAGSIVSAVQFYQSINEVSRAQCGTTVVDPSGIQGRCISSDANR